MLVKTNEWTVQCKEIWVQHIKVIAINKRAKKVKFLERVERKEWEVQWWAYKNNSWAFGLEWKQATQQFRIVQWTLAPCWGNIELEVVLDPSSNHWNTN